VRPGLVLSFTRSLIRLTNAWSMHVCVYLIKKNRLRLRRLRVAAGAFALRHLRARENSAIYCTGAIERSKVPLRPRSEPTVRSQVLLGPALGATERSKVLLRARSAPTARSKMPHRPASGHSGLSKTVLFTAREPLSARKCRSGLARSPQFAQSAARACFGSH